ncbi:hypothetical protein HDU98_006791 [Podochytrium sp. JEL0797]|nr:hypothetical protein HDU98_006791 [Podochytrium sp. JEL0797]
MEVLSISFRGLQHVARCGTRDGTRDGSRDFLETPPGFALAPRPLTHSASDLLPHARDSSTHSALRRPTSAAAESLMLLEQIHGSTVAAVSDLCDSYLTIEASRKVIYRSAIVPCSLNPCWITKDTSFPKMPRRVSDSNLTMKLWGRESTRLQQSPEIESNFSLLLEANFCAQHLVYVGSDLTVLTQPPFPEMVLIEFRDGFYQLDIYADSPSKEECFEATEVKDACDLTTLNEILRAQSELRDLNSSVSALAEQVEQRMPTRAKHVSAPEFLIQLLRKSHSIQWAESESCIARALCLRNETKMRRKMLDIEIEKLDAMRGDIQRRRNRLYYSAMDREQCQQELLDAQQDLNNLGTVVYETAKYKTVYRKDFINGLKEIYPINTLRDDPNAFFIRRIWLPHSEFVDIHEERTAAALGWTAHLVTLLALYLEVPLRYPINPMSSRSMILDRVSQSSFTMEFPLFMIKGSEMTRFEYGVFLLNKNIEQLMNHSGLVVKNLRRTLPNLKLLIDTISKAEFPPNDFLSVPTRVIELRNFEEPEMSASVVTLTQLNSRERIHVHSDDVSEPDSEIRNSAEIEPSDQNEAAESAIESEDRNALELVTPIPYRPTPLQLVSTDDCLVTPAAVSLLERELNSQKQPPLPHPSSTSTSSKTTPRAGVTPEPRCASSPSPLATNLVTLTSVRVTSGGNSQSSSFGPESNFEFSLTSPAIRTLAAPHGTSSSGSTNTLSIHSSASKPATTGLEIFHGINSLDSLPIRSILNPIATDVVDDDSSDDDDDVSDSDEDASNDDEVMDAVLNEMSAEVATTRSGAASLLFPHPRQHRRSRRRSKPQGELNPISSSLSPTSPTTTHTPADGMKGYDAVTESVVSSAASLDSSSSIVLEGNGSVNEASGTTRSVLGTLGWSTFQPLSIAGSLFFNPFKTSAETPPPPPTVVVENLVEGGGD